MTAYRALMAVYVVIVVAVVTALLAGARPMGGPFAAIYNAIFD